MRICASMQTSQSSQTAPNPSAEDKASELKTSSSPLVQKTSPIVTPTTKVKNGAHLYSLISFGPTQNELSYQTDSLQNTGVIKLYVINQEAWYCGNM